MEDLRRRYVVYALLTAGDVHQDVESHLLQLLVRFEAEEAEEQLEVAYALDFHALKYNSVERGRDVSSSCCVAFAFPTSIMFDNVSQCFEGHLRVFEFLGGGLRRVAVHGLERVQVLRLSVEEVEQVDGELLRLLKHDKTTIKTTSISFLLQGRVIEFDCKLLSAVKNCGLIGDLIEVSGDLNG